MRFCEASGPAVSSTEGPDLRGLGYEPVTLKALLAQHLREGQGGLRPFQSHACLKY
jgi:hypothetical protein